MKFKPWFLVPILVILGIMYWSLPEQAPKHGAEDAEATDVMQARKQKEKDFKNGENSPIEDSTNFKGLNYYPYDASWRLDFKVKRVENPQFIQIKMSDGSEERLRYFADIEAEREGQSIRLQLYQHDKGDFFLPFKDKTASTETYGGGRYIDIPLNQLKGDALSINFNSAYLPYCAYNPTYACPIPPKANHLNLWVRAGEKNY